MADTNKVARFEIQINGLKQSIEAVDSLNKQLDQLEQRITKLQQKTINITTTSTSNKSGSSRKELDAEAKLQKQIINQEDKIIAARKDEYQILLHQKKEFREIDNLQKDIAAQERLQADSYANTMNGLKQKLSDIKVTMGNLEIGGADFKKRTKEANDITKQLKELEQSYGQYGRNVGNYAEGVAEGMQKVRVQVGDTTREFNSAREASRTLNNELKTMALNGQQDTEEYKQLNEAVKRVNSTIQDTARSSKMMDNLLDTMESFTALASAGVGLSSLFGLEDSGFEETMKKLGSLLVVLKSFETLNQQWKKGEGLMGGLKNLFKGADMFGEEYGKYVGSGFTRAFKLEAYKLIGKRTIPLYKQMGIDEAYERLEKLAEKYKELTNGKGINISEWVRGEMGFTKGLDSLDPNGTTINSLFKKYDVDNVEDLKRAILGSAEATIKWYKGLGILNKFLKGFTVVARTVSKAIAGIFTGGLMLALPEILDWIGDLVKSFKTAERAAESAAESLNAVNRQLEIQRNILGSQFLKKEINDEEFLNGIYKAEAEALKEQINLIQTRAQALQKNASVWNMFDATQNTEFSGQRMNMPMTVGNGRLTSFFNGGNDLQVTVNDVKELENAWKQCNEAIAENKDYFDKWGSGVSKYWNRIFVTVKDTEQVMKGMGNIALSDLIARFGEINEKYEGGKKNAKAYAAELAKLRNEMNNNQIINSVIANLDKYIPDDKVREAVQNIINEIYRLDDAFNMTSQEQIHYWEQVRIDAMKDGLAKEKAQIAENQRYELATVAKTKEQQDLIKAKYRRQEQNAEEKANKDRLSRAKEYGKKLKDAENELIALRIENMEEGLDKEIALIENERRLAIQKARESGTKSGEIIMQINLKYDKKVLDQKRKWAAEIIKIYEDLQARIEQVSKSTFEKEVDTATRNIEMKQAESLRRLGYETITPSNYDDTKNLEAYYKKVMDIEKKYLDIQTQIQQESLDKQLDYTKAEEELRHRRATDPNDNEFLQQLKAGKITQEQYDKLIEDENTAHAAKMNAIDKEYASNSKKLTEDNLKETQELYSTYYDKIIDGVRNDKAKIDEIASKPPVVDKYGWNVINLKATRANLKEALKQYDELKEGIIQKKEELKNALKNKKIKAEDFAIKEKEFDDEIKAIDEASMGIKQSFGELFGEFMQSINVYIQQVGQAANQIIQSIGDIAEAAFEKEIEAIDKQNDLLEEKLEKQKEITEKYADKVNDIEDELSDARGSRRQYLIDSLNAQMEAQRRSLEQEKAIEKQQEALAKKKEKLEEDEKKRKKSQAITTAIINAALAISNAAVNTYPIPAIPMIALATAVGAAQVAAVKAAKYEQGGLLKGKSHKEGGIKALGGTVELEGQEFVINKKTTMQNLPLLDYINSKKKRIDLNELIDFYQGGTKKAVGNIQRNYFENGGQLPTVRTDVELQGTIYRAMEEYSKKPTYVSVVEILDKAESVQSVKTLAGL